MEQRQQCVSTTASVMPIALGRVYAQRLLPSGYKVSCLKHVQNPLGISAPSIFMYMSGYDIIYCIITGLVYMYILQNHIQCDKYDMICFRKQLWTWYQM